MIGSAETGTFVDGMMQGSHNELLSEAKILTTDPKAICEGGAGSRPGGSVAKYLLCEGSATVSYFMVACGKADAMLDPIINCYDIAPMFPILAGAGGASAPGWRARERRQQRPGVQSEFAWGSAGALSCLTMQRCRGRAYPAASPSGAKSSGIYQRYRRQTAPAGRISLPTTLRPSPVEFHAASARRTQCHVSHLNSRIAVNS
jgi:hypothetical protein